MDVDWNISPDEAFMRSVEMILSRKPTPNTYNFALIRALADGMVGRRFSASDPSLSGSRPDLVSFEQIASRVVRYYWPIALAYRLRQSIDPAQEPTVMQSIRDEAAELALAPHFECWRYIQQHPDRYKSLVSRSCEPGSSMVEAILRLHTVIFYRVEPKLYEVRGKELHLTKGAADFLIRYQQAIERMALAYWVGFTEQLTSSPRLYLKISEGPSVLWNENDRRKYSRIFGELWGKVCFYCGQRPPDDALAIGYVVPFTYVLQARVWNLVLTCEACGAAKGEQTPPNAFVEKLIERNRELLVLIPRSKVGLGNRDLHELQHFGPRLDAHARGLIEGCRGDGFGTWAGPNSSQE